VNVRFIAAAEFELKKVIEYYEAAESGLGARFLKEVDAATDRIVRHPLAWAPISSRTRRCRVNHFPHGLFYQIRPDEILIVTVVDLRRNPERWDEFK
jgi:toxin ParE2